MDFHFTGHCIRRGRDCCGCEYESHVDYARSIERLSPNVYSPKRVKMPLFVRFLEWDQPITLRGGEVIPCSHGNTVFLSTDFNPYSDQWAFLSLTEDSGKIFSPDNGETKIN